MDEDLTVFWCRKMLSIPQLRSPIILTHGFLGFDTLRLGPLVLARYWPRIPEVLRQAGNRVFVAKVNPIGSVAQRAAQLKAFIDKHSPNEPVHIFGHSMGGLDSRYMISRLQMEHRVLSLTTIGTPHRGSSFADWVMRRLEPMVGPVFEFLNISRCAILDLTTERCAKFNQEVLDSPKVRYFSVAGEFLASSLSTWKLSANVVEREEGTNDGVVSVQSATYGEDCLQWDGDHLSLVNSHSIWARIRGTATDRIPQYTSLISRLKDEGF